MRPRVTEEVEKLVLRMVDETPRWGYDRVAGALSNLGHDISDETVGNILKRNGVRREGTRSHANRTPPRSPDRSAASLGADRLCRRKVQMSGFLQSRNVRF
jgi:hypothetical protein